MRLFRQPSRRMAWVLGLICAGLLVFALTRPARADISPPEQPPGSSISPGKQTQVRMQSERVVIEVRARPPVENPDRLLLAGDLAEAQVRADFTMRNQGTADEQMQVRFPLGDPSGEGSGSGEYPLVQNFGASVGDAPVQTTVITTPNPLGGDAMPIQWAAFDVAFPAGQDVRVGVTYAISPTGYLPAARFAYVLETGAGWRDTIGVADVVVRLPYAASTENVMLRAEKTSPGGELEGNEVRWHWENLEPTAHDNLFVTILMPAIWQAILDGRAAVQARPTDVEAQLALARAYEQALPGRYFPEFDDNTFATLSEQTYERVVTLEPNSSSLRAEFARALWRHLGTQVIQDPNDPAVRRIVHELSIALVLDSENQQARDIFDEMQGAAGGALALETPVAVQAPTGTPVPASPTTTPTALPTVAPSQTGVPEPTDVPLTKPADPTSTQAAGGATLAPTPVPPVEGATGGVPLPYILVGIFALLVAVGATVMLRRTRRTG